MTMDSPWRFTFVVVLLAACSNSGSGGNSPPPEQTGQSCTTPAQCYPDLDGGTLKGGAVQCLTQGTTNGYCTHSCTTDADCCAVPGEGRTGYKQDCQPF